MLSPREILLCSKMMTFKLILLNAKTALIMRLPYQMGLAKNAVSIHYLSRVRTSVPNLDVILLRPYPKMALVLSVLHTLSQDILKEAVSTPLAQRDKELDMMDSARTVLNSKEGSTV
jgi:hypothetical protein